MARVLIVDNDTSARQRLAVTFEARGHDVLCAASQADGLRILASAAQDVVVDAASGEPFDVQHVADQNQQLQRTPLVVQAPWLGEGGDGSASLSLNTEVLNELCAEIETQLQADVGAAGVPASMELDRLGDELAVLRLQNRARLTAGVAHEANQPLAAIKNLAWACQRLIADLDSETGEQLSDYHDEISAAASQSGALIRRLARFATLPDGDVRPFPLQEALAETLFLASVEMERAAIQLDRVLCEEPAVVEADRALLQTVLLSRVQDAVSAVAGATGKPGVIEVSLNCDEQFAAVTIRDNRSEAGANDDPTYTFGFEVTDADRRRMQRVCRSVLESQRGDVVTDVVNSEGAEFAFRLPRQLGKNDA